MKRFLITGWELRISVSDSFIAQIHRLCQLYDAEPLLVSIWRDDEKYIPQTLRTNFKIVTKDIIFNSNLILKYVPTSAVASDPVSKWKGVYERSVIIPAIRKRLITEISPRLAKSVMSTGSVGWFKPDIRQYREFKSDDAFIARWERLVVNRMTAAPTEIAKNLVCPSALILELEGKKTFFARYVSQMKLDAPIHDLNYVIDKNGVASVKRTRAFVCGDVHASISDETALQETIKQIRRLSPKEIVLNDFFDGASVNPYHNSIERLSRPTLAEEAKRSKVVLEKFIASCNSDQKTTITYLISNHDVFLDRWLDAGSEKWKETRENYALALELEMWRIKTGKNAVIKLLDLHRHKCIKVVPESKIYRISGVYVRHGHEGIRGGRAGFKAMARAYNHRYNQGHTHQPEIDGDSVNVGTNSPLRQSYQIGADATLHANAIIHEDGSQQLLIIIKGRSVVKD